MSRPSVAMYTSVTRVMWSRSMAIGPAERTMSA
jgi:hypothetical protein